MVMETGKLSLLVSPDKKENKNNSQDLMVTVPGRNALFHFVYCSEPARYLAYNKYFINTYGKEWMNEIGSDAVVPLLGEDLRITCERNICLTQDHCLLNLLIHI